MTDNTYDNIAALLPSTNRRVTQARDIIEQHLAQHNGYLAWSGGKDSTSALILAHSVSPSLPVIWFDSGLEFPETRTYIHDLTKQLSLNLHIIPAEPDALTMLKETGTWDHSAAFAPSNRNFHTTLITIPSQTAHDMFGPGEITGLRAEESVGRRVLLASNNGRYTRQDGTQVCAPIWRWTDTDVRGYLAKNGIPLNPVYARMEALGAPRKAQRAGLVLDGNASEFGRYTWLKAGWPDLYEELSTVLPRLREYR